MSPNTLQKLVDAREDVNPVIGMYQEVYAADGGNCLRANIGSAEALVLDKRLNDALERGKKESDRIQSSLNLLQKSPARPAAKVPVGF